jgi:hypothetical protein
VGKGSVPGTLTVGSKRSRELVKEPTLNHWFIVDSLRKPTGSLKMFKNTEPAVILF